MGLSQKGNKKLRYTKHKNNPKSMGKTPLPNISKLLAPNALKNQSPTSEHSTLWTVAGKQKPILVLVWIVDGERLNSERGRGLGLGLHIVMDTHGLGV